MDMSKGVDKSPGERPACGTRGRGAYNTSIHVFALFLILILSFFSCALPIAVKRFPRLPIPHHFLFLSRHFGTGVLIATAFVHLLPTAYTSLTDPCLPPFWNQRYPAMPGLIAMMSVFAVVSVEMFFASKGAGHSHSHGLDEYFGVPNQDTDGFGNGNALKLRSVGGNGHITPFSSNDRSDLESQPRMDRDGVVQNRKGRPERLNLGKDSIDGLGESESEDGEDLGFTMEDDPFEDDGDASGLLREQKKDKTYAPRTMAASPMEPDTPHSRTHLHHNTSTSQLNTPRIPSSSLTGNRHHPSLTSEDEAAANSRALLQCLLLEAGILFHSIFIGMAVSVATGPPFAVLLVAISFHQTFEGLALGSRISALNFPKSSIKPWLMALAYGTTTPIGQAIGLGVHGLYDPASEVGLLVVGVTNAVSSGLLLFAGLVELLAEDFLSEKSYVSLKGKRRLQACASVLAGAMLMALVGAWA